MKTIIHKYQVWRLATVFAMAACLLGHWARADWKAGFAAANITPRESMFLSGYASRNKPFESVESDLFLKALALEDSQGNQGLLITSDLLGFQAYFADPMCEQIERATGLARDQILLNSSHTHTGPLLNPDRRFGLDTEQAQRVRDYVKHLTDQTVVLSEQALLDLKPAKLSHGVGVAPFVMNRRQFTESGVRLGVNPSGLADRSVPVLRIDDPDGNLRGVLFGCAAHNTTLGAVYTVCGDYAGFAQSYLESKYSNIQAMFMLGCAGDANPYPRGSVELSREHGTTLGMEVARLLETNLRSVGGPLSTRFIRIDLPLQPFPPKASLEQMKSAGGWQAFNAEKMLERLDRGEPIPDSFSYPASVWQFGTDLTMIGLAGEVVVDYVRRFEQSLGPLGLWTAGYCNDNFGYLPSARVIREGGYETRGIIYGGVGYFATDAEDILVNILTQLVMTLRSK